MDYLKIKDNTLCSGNLPASDWRILFTTNLVVFVFHRYHRVLAGPGVRKSPRGKKAPPRPRIFGEDGRGHGHIFIDDEAQVCVLLYAIPHSILNSLHISKFWLLKHIFNIPYFLLLQLSGSEGSGDELLLDDESDSESFLNDSPLEEDDPLSFYRRHRTSPTLNPFYRGDPETNTSWNEEFSVCWFFIFYFYFIFFILVLINWKLWNEEPILILIWYLIHHNSNRPLSLTISRIVLRKKTWLRLSPTWIWLGQI